MGVVEEPGLILRHRLTVDAYLRMGEAGVLDTDAQVELIDGDVVDMAPMRSRHASVVRRLNAALVRAVGDRAQVSCQLPLVLGDRSAPEPDLMLLAPRADFYRQAHPVAADVRLLIEVSDTTSDYDRLVKLPLYARHGVIEVWIIDLDHALVHGCRKPQADSYADIVTTAAPGPMVPAALPGVSIDLTGVLA